MALPPELQTLAAQRRAHQQELSAGLVTLIQRLWRQIDPAEVHASWRRLVQPLLTAMTAAQAQVAAGAQAYVAAAVTAQGVLPSPAGTVAAGAFAATAADGRLLSTLLLVPAVEVEASVRRGVPVDQALEQGRRRLERMVVTEIADAARVATSVAQVNDRSVRRYVRMVTPPSCARCIILSGKSFATNRGFQRHPLCDCVHVPVAERIKPTRPLELFKAMSAAKQDQVFTKAGAQAIRDGADINQVVNARRGMRSAGVFGRRALITLEGTTRRASTGRRLGGEGGFRKVPGERLRRAIPVRLMPEQIYADARRLGYDRERTIGLLKLHGYIV